jgi:hypothetical protein
MPVVNVTHEAKVKFLQSIIFRFSVPKCNTLCYDFTNYLLITFISSLTMHQIPWIVKIKEVRFIFNSNLQGQAKKFLV